MPIHFQQQQQQQNGVAFALPKFVSANIFFTFDFYKEFYMDRPMHSKIRH